MAKGLPARFAALRDALTAFCRERADAGGPAAPMLADVGAELAGLELPAVIDPPGRLPGCRHYAGAMAEALAGPLAGVAAAYDALEPDLAWVQTEHYRAALGDDHMANYAYANLVGWQGLVPHARIATGLFVIGPGRHYPDHHHEAEEIYVPLCGDTLWSQAGRPATTHAPGSMIHNPPWQRHEMTTQTTPLFAVYFWRGPVLDKARLVA